VEETVDWRYYLLIPHDLEVYLLSETDGETTRTCLHWRPFPFSPPFPHSSSAEKDRCENPDVDCVHPPTSLVYIAGVLREQGCRVSLFDMNAYARARNYRLLDLILKAKGADWIIFRSTPSTFYHDIKVVEIAKKYGIHTLMLNWNLHFAYDQVLKECPDLDVYLNEYHYEYAIPQILKKFPYHPRLNFPKTRELPMPAWDLIPSFEPYYTRTRWLSPWAVVRGSKGCPFQCHFCIDANTGWYPRSPELIVDEIEYLVKQRKVPYISFFDNTFEIDENWCLNIVDEILARKLKFKWYINSRADSVCKRGLSFFKRLREAGCDGSSIGIEFGTDEMLKFSAKGTTVKQGEEAIDILHKSKIKTYVSCMIGYLSETKEQMLKTEQFIKRTKPTGFQINIVVPFNGTPLYEEALEKGVIDEQQFDWRGLSCVPTDVVPVKLSELEPRELQQLRRKMYRRIYFSSWLLHNIFRIRNIDDLKLGFGYFISSLEKLKRGVKFSH